MDQLPEEILVEIFKYLPKESLLNLTKISKYFNFVIGFYPELFYEIPLIIKHNDNEWINTRRYSSIVIKNFIKDEHQSIIEKIGEEIISLKILKWYSDKENLLEIFKFCPNLKSLKFSKVQTFSANSLNDCDLPKYEDLNLELEETDASVLNLFRNCSVKKFTYDYTPRGGLEIPEVIEFLKGQKNLTDLTLSGFIVFLQGGGLGRVIFNDNSLSNVEFRLKRLTLKKSPLCPTVYFNNFIKLHSDTLDFVEISEIDNFYFTNFISSCTNLTKLKLGKRKFETFVPSQKFVKITWLSAEGNVDKTFLEFFPNLKYLNVTNFKVSPNSFDYEICDKLEKLIIQKTWMGGFFKFKGLKVIHLQNISLLSPKVFEINNQIEEIYANDCSGMNENILKSIHENCKYIKILNVK